MATIITRAGKGSPLENAEVDANFTNLNTDKIESGDTVASLTITSADINGGTIDGATIGGSSAAAITGTTITGTSFVSSGDMTFGDNDKAIFGAGSDLQIYHDGDHSYIKDAGTGSLRLLIDDFNIRDTANSQNMMRAFNDGAVELYYDGLQKLATTSTGIDVTGTVTADGLTVDGAIVRLNQSSVSNNLIRFTENSVINNHIGTDGSGNVKITGNSFTNDNIAKFSSNGDISFYEHTGTTPKFFWDASAESLGIGTSSPAYSLHVRTSEPTASILETTTADNIQLRFKGVSGERWAIGNNIAFGGTGLNFDIYDLVNSQNRMRIDSSGNVGIGTSSPSGVGSYKVLQITGGNTSNGGMIRLETSNGTSGIGRLYTGSDATVLEAYSNDPLLFGTNATERMRIDSSGNVGIGTSSPNGKLHVEGGEVFFKHTGNSKLQISAGNTSSSYIEFGDPDDGDVGRLLYSHSDNSMQFRVNATERMRIDSSGNLLVGKTSTAFGTGGIEIRGSDDASYFTRSGNAPVHINRLSSDGEIVRFNKDSSLVGSISAWSSGLLVGTGDVGLAFVDGTPERIQPRKADDQTSADGLIDLGHSSNRFKDLYLSGGAYIGGTGSANYLDDYEAGTWTPTVEGSTSAGTANYTSQFGTYVKVGSLVHLNFKVYVTGHTGSGEYRIKGLPFTNGSNNAAAIGSLMLYQFDLDNSAVMVTAFCSPSYDYIALYQTLDNANWTTYEISNSTDYLFGSITLKVDV